MLTPLAVGLGRPFPYISNLSLSLAVLVRDPQTEQETFARVKVPKEMLPRFVPIGDGRTFVPLEDLIAQHLDALFPGMEIVDYDVFRVTRGDHSARWLRMCRISALMVPCLPYLLRWRHRSCWLGWQCSSDWRLQGWLEAAAPEWSPDQFAWPMAASLLLHPSYSHGIFSGCCHF